MRYILTPREAAYLLFCNTLSLSIEWEDPCGGSFFQTTNASSGFESKSRDLHHRYLILLIQVC